MGSGRRKLFGGIAIVLVFLAGAAILVTGDEDGGSDEAASTDTRSVPFPADDAAEIEGAENVDDIPRATLKQVIYSRCVQRIQELGDDPNAAQKGFCACSAKEFMARMTPEDLSDIQAATEAGAPEPPSSERALAAAVAVCR